MIQPVSALDAARAVRQFRRQLRKAIRGPPCHYLQRRFHYTASADVHPSVAAANRVTGRAGLPLGEALRMGLEMTSARATSSGSGVTTTASSMRSMAERASSSSSGQADGDAGLNSLAAPPPWRNSSVMWARSSRFHRRADAAPLILASPARPRRTVHAPQGKSAHPSLPRCWVALMFITSLKPRPAALCGASRGVMPRADCAPAEVGHDATHRYKAAQTDARA